MTNQERRARQEAIDFAMHLGQVAFESGRRAVPALDPAFCALLKDGAHLMEKLDAWTTGWHVANVEAPVPGVTDSPEWRQTMRA